MLLSNTIFDIGFHKSEDIDFYLSKGYTVVAVDADSTNILEASQRFEKQIISKKLFLHHNAITDRNDVEVEFYKSNFSSWSSIKEKIASRKMTSFVREVVIGKKLSYFFKKFGTPIYCKIDIEGYDLIALESLDEVTTVPKYISVETECIGEGEQIDDNEVLATLLQLKRLGYNKFKLIEQSTLTELLPFNKFFEKDFQLKDCRQNLFEKMNYNFSRGSSGPFGKYLSDAWLSFEDAKRAILFHRQQYFTLANAKSYGFWCDWHATF